MLELQPIAAKITTFYSFKGGVGRTMALYNCACILAGAGRRVLMLDMDLEAPGLSFFLREQEKAAKRRKKKARAKKHEPKGGMVEIITAYIDKPESWPLRDGESPARIEEFCQDVDIPETALRLMGPGRLALLPAGRLDDAYEKRLAGIQWDASPLSEVRDNLFLHLREVLRQSALFDYVLIDARTGWSDESYVAARFMADDLVVLSGLNTQNVLGTAGFLRHVDAWNREEEGTARRVILVGSPVPLGEEAAKKERKEQVRKVLRQELGRDTEFTLTLSYNARLALYEEPIVSDWPDTPLAREYRHLAGMLRDLAGDDVDYWIGQVNALQQELGRPKPATGTPEPLPRSAPNVAALAKAMAGLASNDEDLFRQVAIPVTQALTNRKTPPEGVEDLLRDLIAGFKDEPYFMLQAARMHRRTARIDSALACLEEAKAIAAKAGNRPALQAIAEERGETYQEQNAYPHARAAFLEARKLAEEMEENEEALYALDLRIARITKAAGNLQAAEHEYGTLLEKLGEHGFLDLRGAVLHDLGNVRHTQSRDEDASAYFEQSLAIERELGNRVGEAAALHGLGNCAHGQGRYEDAMAYYEQSLEIERELGNRRGEAASINGLGNCAQSQGRYEDAIAYHTQSIAIERELGNRRGEAVSLNGLGNCAESQGRYEDAIAYYEQSLAINRELRNREGEAVGESNMGETLFRMGRSDEARVHCEAALSVSIEMGFAVHESAARMRLAALDFVEGAVEKDALNRCIRVVGELRDPYDAAGAWLLAAEACVHRGLADDALEALDLALGWTMDGMLAGIEAQARAMRALLLAERGNRAQAEADAAHAIAFFDAQNVRYTKRAELEALLTKRPKRAPKKAQGAGRPAKKSAAKKQEGT